MDKKEFNFPENTDDWKKNYKSIKLNDLLFYYKLKREIFVNQNHYFQLTEENFIRHNKDAEQALKEAIFNIIMYSDKKTIKFYIKNID